MTVKTIALTIQSQGNADIQDISQALENAVAQSGLKNGTVTVFSPSSTSAVTTIEYESGCLSDLRRLFNEIIDPRQAYAHNAKWGDGNGHSHVRAALLGPSLTIPFVGEHLTLGTWQQVVFVDFDVRPRQRELVVQVMGE